MELNSVAAANMSATRGKSPQSIGHLAKMAVAQARDAGAGMPKGAQGVAASAFAKGADMESVLASLIAADPADEGPDTPDVVVDPPVNVPDADTPVSGPDTPTVTAGSDALTLPEVSVAVLPDAAGGTAPPQRDPVPARTDAPLDAVAASMAETVARDALEMLFGQSDTGDSG